VNHLGFTLIELLVVITIIWILAVGSVTVYTSQIQKARDSTRLTDIENLRSSVEQFYADISRYPNKVEDWWSWWIVQYLPNLAQDPKTTELCNKYSRESNTGCDYTFKVKSDTNGILNNAYELSTGFEADWNKSKVEWDNWDDDQRYEVGSWNGVNQGNIDTGLLRTGTIILTKLTTGDANTQLMIIQKDWLYKQ
jgi:prepilin-type N-terminal cleavage/methylation domain-containing protein